MGSSALLEKEGQVRGRPKTPDSFVVWMQRDMGVRQPSHSARVKWSRVCAPASQLPCVTISVCGKCCYPKQGINKSHITKHMTINIQLLGPAGQHPNSNLLGVCLFVLEPQWLLLQNIWLRFLSVEAHESKPPSATSLSSWELPEETLQH